ncbi:MAG: CoxF protein [Hyphomicrobiales bacterium]|nr:CoxF protein [Hyphomicrobiales bacterium]
MMREVKNGVVLSEEEKRRRRQRSLALALVLGALVLLFYAISIIKQSAALNALHS